MVGITIGVVAFVGLLILLSIYLTFQNKPRIVAKSLKDPLIIDKV
jgi:hypothetical protein